MGQNMLNNCINLTERRQKCHNTYGKFGEDCLVEELEEKRCLSFLYCPTEAQAYYVTPLQQKKHQSNDDDNTSININKKGLCASWAESFCFANPNCSSMNNNDVDGIIRQHHISASDKVNLDPKLKSKCRSIA